MAARFFFKGLTYLGGLTVSRGAYNHCKRNVLDKEIAKGSKKTIIFLGGLVVACGAYCCAMELLNVSDKKNVSDKGNVSAKRNVSDKGNVSYKRNVSDTGNVSHKGNVSDKWSISDKEIAKGSNGAVIFEGSYGPQPARKAVVKRVVGVCSDVGREEYNMYIEADGFSNIVRCYGMESDRRYVYLFLEPCICSLKDLVQIYSPYALQNFQSESETRLISVKNVLGNRVTLWKENDYPSPLLLKLMRDVVSGLMNLHENKIVHLNLAPRNILMAGKTPNLCAKLSDMAKSKKFTGDNSSSGHYASFVDSEQLQFHDEAAKDLFLLGYILSFCIHGGRYPFPNPPERYNTNCSPPEAADLISPLISKSANMRPKAIDVYRHPLFWNSDKKLSFLRDTSDMAEGNKEDQLSKELKKLRGQVIGSSWDTKIDSKLISSIEDRGVRFYRKYNYDNFPHLLRLMRNYFHHYLELPKDIQELVGSKPEGYYEYFETRFPNLLIEVYKVVRKFCKEEDAFQKYFHSNLAE